MEVELQSLAKIAALPGDYEVYPGHMDCSTLETERRFNPYLTARCKTADSKTAQRQPAEARFCRFCRFRENVPARPCNPGADVVYCSRSKNICPLYAGNFHQNKVREHHEHRTSGLWCCRQGRLRYARRPDDIRAAWVLCRRDLGELTARTTYEMQDILDDPAVDTVVEVMGGLHPAYEYVAAALRAGKNVVSSNKYLMCRYYDELTALANEHGAALRCTAAVGGGIPWLTNLEKAAHANHISRVWGILNGTTNYIMDAMHGSDADFADVLAQAQALGYAEADPSADIDGLDIQRKLILSANVAFGVSLREADAGVRHPQRAQGGHRPLSGARLHVQADRSGRAERRQHPRLRRADAAEP